MELIDAHNHLQDAALSGHLAEIVPALSRIGLRHAVVNGTTEADWPAVAALAARYPWVLPSYGLHPWYIKERSPHWLTTLADLLDRSPRCAVGEIGLDRWMEHPDPDDQAEVFTAQLHLATERDLPVTIHCLKAWGALEEILSTHPRSRSGFLLHAYGGPSEMVKRFVDLGAYFSFSPSFLDPRKAKKLDPFRIIPPERLLVETDAPSMAGPAERRQFLLPEHPSMHGTVQHPAEILTAYQGLAEVRGWTLPRLTAQISENFQRLFLNRPTR